MDSIPNDGFEIYFTVYLNTCVNITRIARNVTVFKIFFRVRNERVQGPFGARGISEKCGSEWYTQPLPATGSAY